VRATVQELQAGGAGPSSTAAIDETLAELERLRKENAELRAQVEAGAAARMDLDPLQVTSRGLACLNSVEHWAS
jgi:hypothetical protein